MTFQTYRKEIINANILEAVAGTTGYQGGDSGYGCRTYIRIADLGSTDMEVKVLDKGKGFEIDLGGDAELATIIEAFEYVAGILKREAGDKSETGNSFYVYLMLLTDLCLPIGETARRLQWDQTSPKGDDATVWTIIDHIRENIGKGYGYTQEDCDEVYSAWLKYKEVRERNRRLMNH